MCKQRGFTLVEILVVLIIISILAGIVGVSVLHRPAEARAAAARIQIKNFRAALQLYQSEQGRYPTQNQGLEALCVKPTLPPIPEYYPADGYLDSRRPPQDPWGRDYLYLVPGRQGEPFEVLSYGADGAEGGAAEARDFSSADE